MVRKSGKVKKKITSMLIKQYILSNKILKSLKLNKIENEDNLR